jgi:aspartate racemase
MNRTPPRQPVGVIGRTRRRFRRTPPPAILCQFDGAYVRVSRFRSVKTLGLLGGIGPESTIAYYRAIMAAAPAGPPDRGQPPILINSIDVQKVLRLAGTHALRELTEYLVEEVERLAKAAADLALLAANTPHIVFDDVRSHVSIPMVSIVEATRDVARATGLQRLGLFGTRFTMQGHFYPDVFSKAGLEIVPPRDDEQAFIHDKYVNELLNGTFAGSTRDALLRLVDVQRARDRIDAVILAGTELPLVLTDPKAASIPLLDTTDIHVKAAVKLAWA